MHVSEFRLLTNSCLRNYVSLLYFNKNFESFNFKYHYNVISNVFHLNKNKSFSFLFFLFIKFIICADTIKNRSLKPV